MAAAPARRGVPSAVRPLARPVIGRLLLFTLLAVGYWVVGPGQRDGDPFNPLAAAFLDGRLSIAEPMPALEAVPAPDGGWYTPLAPGPAFLLLPVVAVVGPGVVDSNLLAAIAGAASVWLAWGVMRRMGTTPGAAAWLTIALALGTELTWVAATGGPHLVSQALAMAFLLGSLRLALDGRAPIAAGFLWSIAVACRVPVALAFPLLAWCYRDRLLALAAGALPIAAVLAGYNVARFGNPVDFGLARIVGPSGSVLDEPWYAHGILSPAYLPQGLHTMLLRSFDYVEQAPWFRPNWMGASILLTMPALLWLRRAVHPSLAVAWLAAGLVLLPDLMHGNPGFTQFGYRYICDVLPILWLLLAWAVVRHGLTRGLRAALIAGVVVNLYGLVAIWGLGFVSF